MSDINFSTPLIIVYEAIIAEQYITIHQYIRVMFFIILSIFYFECYLNIWF